MAEPNVEGPKELLGGFAPLVVAAVLAILVVLLVPSVAPERIVRVPVEGGAATTTTTTTTTTGAGAP
ncbi:MAG TPA: hypothetical protein VFK43_15780 [Acidimicrobiales bacterium]|nr:hypothetical protein [Acidimicrobiales bacterium]